MNFLLAGILCTMFLYVLSETTFVFEKVASFFTRTEYVRSAEGKSLESFLESHYEIICLLGPAILIIVVTSTYI